MSRLVNKETGQIINVGDRVTSFRGDIGTVIEWIDPKHRGSTGRIVVQMHDKNSRESFYPGVFNCEIENYDG